MCGFCRKTTVGHGSLSRKYGSLEAETGRNGNNAVFRIGRCLFALFVECVEQVGDTDGVACTYEQSEVEVCSYMSFTKKTESVLDSAF